MGYYNKPSDVTFASGSFPSASDNHCRLLTRFGYAFVRRTFTIEKVFSNDFYADVTGITTDEGEDPSLETILKWIFSEYLISPPPNFNFSNQSDWKYAFTISESINI